MARVQYSFSSRRTGHIENIKKQRPKFPKLVKEIIGISDIVLEVLDARFIEETRNKEFENEIKTQKKKIIYVLNKSDLIDLNSKIHEINLLKLFPAVFVSSKNRTGISNLRARIKVMVKKIDLGEKKRAQVGIIGYPNTGKSSLINVLTGRSSARTGAESGFTKGMQKIRFTKDILILDTPGVIPESEYSPVKLDAINKQAKVGARTIDKIRDPESVVANLMKTHAKQIESYYDIDAGGDSEKLLEELGKKRHFLKKGGVADEDRTSRQIIRDWQEGRIKL